MLISRNLRIDLCFDFVFQNSICSSFNQSSSQTLIVSSRNVLQRCVTGQKWLQGGLRVRFFTKIQDQIKNPDHQDFSKGKETMYPKKDQIFMNFYIPQKRPTIERFSIMFTSNGNREFVPRDQVSPLLVVYCSLFQHINWQFHAIFYP